MSGRLVPSPVNPGWMIPAGWEPILGLQIDYRLGGSILHLWRVQLNQHIASGEQSSAAHVHNVHQLLYYQRGAGTLEVDGCDHAIEPGSIFFVPAERPHRFISRSTESVVCLAVDFTIDTARTIGSGSLPMQSEAAVLLSLIFARPARPFPLEPRDQLEIDAAIAAIVLENDQREVGFAALIQAQLLRLIALCLRGTQRASGFGAHFRHTAWRHRVVAERALAVIRDQATQQPELTLGQLARHCGASPNHLNRILRNQLGRTFHELLIRERLERARALLMEGRLNCTEAALECGFNDSNYFSRAFRKVYGHAPSDLLQ
jgi:AraC-like DNA-binding protein